MNAKRISGIALMACAALWTAAGVSAQTADEKPPVYTYVAQWDIPRAMWADYEKLMAGENDARAKLVSDGTLLNFGSAATVSHQKGGATHSSWFTASSMANLMKVLEGVRSSSAATSPVFAASKHWDLILTSRHYNSRPGTFTNSYLRVATWMRKPGASDPGDKLLKLSMVAMLEKMLADGDLHAYTIEQEIVHSMDANAFSVVLLTNGAEGLDKFNAAVEDMQKNNPAALVAFEALTDNRGHRDVLEKVTTMTYK